MSATRALLRPLMRTQPSLAARLMRPAAIAPMSTQTKTSRVVLPEEKMIKMQPLRSAMPQLVPFFFVNEVATAWILLPTMIYLFSKYLLPQKVRLFAARLFISKL